MNPWIKLLSIWIIIFLVAQGITLLIPHGVVCPKIQNSIPENINGVFVEPVGCGISQSWRNAGWPSYYFFDSSPGHAVFGVGAFILNIVWTLILAILMRWIWKKYHQASPEKI